MKIVSINLTNTDQSDFIHQVSDTLNIEIVDLNYNQGNPEIISDDFYTKLSLGALTLEQYIIDNSEYNTPNKKFFNALIYWEHDINKIDKLIPYVNVFTRNWFLVQDQTNPNWIFGDISALTKWAGSLYKINKDEFYIIDQYLKNNLTSSLVYAGRIGMNVQGLI
jgi:hypothetical protein